MPIDSTADLLFRIGANSDDAESNLVRFRSLLSKDMSDITGEFGDWSGKIIGQVTTLQGAVTAGAALLATGIVALGAFANEATNKYEAYVEEVARGSKTTGIAIGDMSGLKFAAEATNTSYDALVTGLTKFASIIVKASEGGATQMAMFTRLGISQNAVNAGAKDMLPLLMQVSDKFHDLGSKVERTAEAKDLFTRGGPELVNFLSLGSKGIQELIDKAKAMGLTLGVDDVHHMLEYKASLRAIKEQHEALEIVIGNVTLPMEQFWASMKAGAFEAAVEMVKAHGAWELVAGVFTGQALTEFYHRWIADTAELDATIKKQTLGIGALGDAELKHAQTAKAANAEFSEFSRLLQEIRTKAADTEGAEAKLTEEILKLQAAMQKAEADFTKLRAAGGQSAAQIKEQLQIFQDARAAFSNLVPELWGAFYKKGAEAIAAGSADLRSRLLHEGAQTVEVQQELFELEMAALKARLVKEGAFKGAAVEMFAQLERAGLAKIAQAKIDAIEKTGADIEAQTQALQERTYAQKVADWNRQIDGERETCRRLQNMTAENEALLATKRETGLAKIDRGQALAFATEINKLAQHLETITKKHETAAQVIEAQYLVDVGKFGAAEEAKSIKAMAGEAQRTQIAQLYAAIRTGLLVKEGQDLAALRNSAGWQGVFGSQFAQMIKGNEALTKEWASSTNQSVMMVRVTMEGLREQGQKTFEQFAQGMGSGIANAIVYSTSVGAAMRAALTSTLESLASQALVYAIYAAGLGFLRLAEHDAPGATAAFESAAIWGSIGAASAVAGRAIAPSQTAAAASAGGAGSTAAGSSAAGSTGSAGQQGPKVTVNVYGHIFGVSGVEQVAAALNDAVLNRDVTLTATNTKTGVQVTR